MRPCIIHSFMESHCLRLASLPHTTKLFAAYLEDFSRVKAFYVHTPDEAGVTAAARAVDLTTASRRAVVEVLREQNRAFGADAATERDLDRLAKGAVAIVTGQQVGLFGGPAYSFYKALTAIRWAETLTARGIDAVPVFWLATEDHDLAEVNQCLWLTKSGTEKFTIAAAEEFAGAKWARSSLGLRFPASWIRLCGRWLVRLRRTSSGRCGNLMQLANHLDRHSENSLHDCLPVAE